MNILVIICTLSPYYTFAPWISRPEVPNKDISKTCVDWILYHKFVEDPSRNKELALTRDVQYDNDVSLWAAGYAYSLVRNEYYFDLSIFGPRYFCNRLVIDFAKFYYMTLQDAEFSCEGWIDFYGHNHKGHYKQNHEWALHRNKLMDNRISIWAAGYFRFIASHPDTNHITTAEYCFAMGQAVNEVALPEHFPFMAFDGSKMSSRDYLKLYRHIDETDLRVKENATKRLPFMTYHDTKLSCQEWIELHGYTDSIEWGFQLAKVHSEQMSNILDYRTRDYANLLHKERTYVTPKYFCDLNHMPITLKLHYFHELI